MKCATCGQPIHPIRLGALPNTVTCSAKCSRGRQAHLRREGAKRQRAREADLGRAARRAPSPTPEPKETHHE